MGHRKFLRGRYNSNSRGDKFEQINQTTYFDFALYRFGLIPESQFDEFAYHQSSEDLDLSSSLLEFKGINLELKTGLDNFLQVVRVDEKYNYYSREVDLELIDDSTLVFEKKITKIQQQLNLLLAVTSKIEKNLQLNTSENISKSKIQLEPLGHQTLIEEDYLYHDFNFSGNYQYNPEGSQQPTSCKRRTFDNLSIQSQITNLFQIPIKDGEFIYLESIDDFINISQKMKSKQSKQNQEIKNLSIFFPSFVQLEDFYQFDDMLQTIFIDHSKNFEQFRIFIDYENPLVIICLLRFLLIINSCNIITLEFTKKGSNIKERNIEESFNRVQKVSLIFERIFAIVLSIRNLQSLSIQMNTILFPNFCSGIKQIADPSKLNLRYFYLNGDLKKVNPSNMSECIEFFSRIPSLYAFQTDTIVICGKKSEEQFQKLLKNIQSIEFQLLEIPSDFSLQLPFRKLIKLDAVFAFQSNSLNQIGLNQLLSSIGSAKNLKILKLTINHSTSGRSTHVDGQTLKGSESFQSDEQSNQDFQLFEHLIDLKDLEQLSINCDISEVVYDSLLKLLQKNSNILEMKLYLSNPHQQQLNYRNIFEILSNRKNLKFFQLLVQISIEIVYRLRNNKFFFSCNDRSQEDFCLPQMTANFNSTQFKFNNITQMQLKLNLSFFDELENLFQSIENTPNLAFLELSTQLMPTLSEQLPKEPKSNPMFRFFHRLENLQYLKHLDSNIFVNQQVLDSLESFIRKSVSLRSLFFRRNSSNQYYLNYVGIFNALSASKSIEQLYWNSGIEEITAPSQKNLQKWEETKLANFYQPFADLYRKAPSQLKFIEVNELKPNYLGLNVLLEGIIASSHQMYTKFTPSFYFDIKEITNEHSKSLINQASIKGYLVERLYYFPLSLIPKYHNQYV